MANLGTKLKALLAAGLIGTAGLGMQSCSNPSDSVYYPYTVETTTTGTETTNPGGGGTENPNPNGDNEGEKGETVDKFEELGVTDADVKRRIAYTTAVESVKKTCVNALQEEAELLSGFGHVYLYIETEKKFQDVLLMKGSTTPIDLIKYSKENNHYCIPESMKESFNNAIAAYKASQSN